MDYDRHPIIMSMRSITALLACLTATGCVFGFDTPAVQQRDAGDADEDVILDGDAEDADDPDADPAEDPDGDEMDVPTDDAVGDVIEDGGEAEAVTCDPGGEDDHCDDNSLMRCNAAGDGFTEFPCEDRICVQDPAARCTVMGVHNVDDDTLLCAGTAGITALDIPEGMVWVALLTDTGEVYAFNDDLSEIHNIRTPGEGDVDGRVFTVQEQPGEAPTLGILSLSELQVPAGTGFLSIGDRAAAILVCGPVVIDGAMSASAVPSTILPHTPGPGGQPGGTFFSPDGQGPGGGEAGTASLACTAGGGGGSHGGSGGSGGDAAEATGGVPGATYGPLDLLPLTAGSGGGAGGAPDGYDCAGEGGEGGGALLLASSVSIHVSTTGGLDAGGGAGRGGLGCGETVGGGGGGGGGSGGAILLEAPLVTIEGFLLAAGGGGGAGAASGLVKGMDGTNGVLAVGPAQGGTGSLLGTGGGWGGFPLSGDAEDGIDTDCSTLLHAGGAGGGDGILRINGMSIEISSALLHPGWDSGLLSTGDPLYL